MAHALAAMCAPLQVADVIQAADRLNVGSRVAHVSDQLLRQGADLMTVQRVVEALRALRDAGVTDSDLAAWLMARETGADVDSSGQAAAAERVYQKLGPALSRLVSPGGTRVLLARALHVARPEFPFLRGVTAGAPPGRYLSGLSERMPDTDAGEASQGLQAVLGILLDLLFGFIGLDLTVRLAREVWPDLPEPTPGVL